MSMTIASVFMSFIRHLHRNLLMNCLSLQAKSSDPLLPYLYIVTIEKNLGRLWLAYTEAQVGFYMLQFTSVDSSHFTQR